MKTTTLNTAGDRPRHGPQRPDVDQTQPAGEAVVDPAGGVVERRVRADDRHPGAGQPPEQARLRLVGPDLLDRPEQDRMMADDQLGPFVDRLVGRPA